MPGSKRLVWPHSDHYGLTIPHPSQPFFRVDWIKPDSSFDEIISRFLNFRKMPIGTRSKFSQECNNRLVGTPNLPARVRERGPRARGFRANDGNQSRDPALLECTVWLRCFIAI